MKGLIFMIFRCACYPNNVDFFKFQAYYTGFNENIHCIGITNADKTSRYRRPSIIILR